jgi:hypothetical protein
MKKTALALTLISALLLSAVTGILTVNPAKANPMFSLTSITIESDGSINPGTEIIRRDGNVYSLTVDLSYKYAIKIQCNNIVLDGAGHIVNGTVPSPSDFAGWTTENSGLSVEGVTNVTVRDIEITGFNDFDAAVKNCHECVFQSFKADDGFTLENSSSNTISESNIAGIYAAVQPGLYMTSSNGNKFYRNNITDLLLRTSNSNVFFANNFVINHFLSMGGNNLWDNGEEGNYWSDYETKYPNASESGNSGVGDTPYVIDKNNRDNYPLMMPYEIAPTLSPEPTLKPEPFPTTLLIGSAIAVVAVVGLGLLVYLKKHPKDEKQ